MNIITKRLTQITMIAAVLAAGVTAQPSQAAERALRIVQLPPVVVIAKRIRVVELERVVITATRIAPAPEVVAQRGPRSPSAQSAGRG